MKNLLRICVVMLAAACVLPAAAADAETLYHTDYCFSEADFDLNEAEMSGIFVKEVPAAEIARICLGSRTIRAGDVLPAEVLEQLRLVPVCAENCSAVFRYQPICGSSLAEQETLTVHIRSGKNESPKAFDGELETYKNIANDGTLRGSDPEEGELTYQIAENPKRGTVELHDDGTFLYTPNKNKVGEDSFTFTVTDDAGNVSAPATVKIRILKPTESKTFADISNGADVFEAMWLCSSGLSGGRSVVGRTCFLPTESVSRGEFLVMAMELCGVEVDDALTVSGFADAQEASAWMQPYLAAAMRRGIVSGESAETGLIFRPNDAVTNREAAVMLQNLLNLPISAAATESDLPAWAAEAVQALSEAGVVMDTSDAPLTRMEAAKLLYQVSKL